MKEEFLEHVIILRASRPERAVDIGRGPGKAKENWERIRDKGPLLYRLSWPWEASHCPALRWLAPVVMVTAHVYWPPSGAPSAVLNTACHHGPSPSPQ